MGKYADVNGIKLYYDTFGSGRRKPARIRANPTRRR